MRKYAVQIDAANLLVTMEGKLAKYGFITYRFVEADDPSAAEEAAIAMIRDDEGLSELIQNEPGDPPRMNVEEIREVEQFERGGQPGRVWYEMKPKRWWQFWRR